ncbi:Protein zwilch-like protein [Armadillidium vulgare]|nr:Protein zwilch-like protein [Armadillidium vulgare]
MSVNQYNIHIILVLIIMTKELTSSFSNISNFFDKKEKSDVLNDHDEKFLEVLRRFKGLRNHKENIFLFNENLRITRYDREESLFSFPFDSPSFIIFEKYQETEVGKPIGNLNEWDSAKVSSTPKSMSETSSKASELDITGSPLSCHFLDLKSPELDMSQDIFETNIKRKFMRYCYYGLPIQQSRNENFNAILTITSYNLFVGKENIPNVDYINSEFTLGSVLPNVKTKVEAIYEIVPQNLRKPCSTVDLHCQWNQTLSTLSSPSLDAETVALIHLEIDDENSPARNLFSEYQTLQGLINGCKEKCIKWRKNKLENVLDRLQKYLDAYGSKDISVAGRGDLVPDLNKMVESKFIDIRPSKEFPEEIWDILKDSSCATELADGFKIIFKSIANGIIRPRIHVKNETEFATICRNLMRGQSETPSFGNWEAIHMLIQIGLDKVKKDYVSIFQVCDLVNSEQLYYYASWSSKKISFEECLTKLEKMLLVIQMVVLLKRTLNLPNPVLSRLTTKALITLEQEKDLSKDFEYQLETSLLKNVVDNLVPSIWVYEIASVCEENKNFEKSQRFAVKRDESYFKTDTGDILEVSTSSEMQNFHCLSLCEVGDIFCV